MDQACIADPDAPTNLGPGSVPPGGDPTKTPNDWGYRKAQPINEVGKQVQEQYNDNYITAPITGVWDGLESGKDVLDWLNDLRKCLFGGGGD